jgi:Bacterial toxin 34
VPGSGNGVWSENPGIDIYGPPGSGGGGPPCDFGDCGAGVPGGNGFGPEAGAAAISMPWVVFTATGWASALTAGLAGGVLVAGTVALPYDVYQGYHLAQAYGHFLPGQPMYSKGGKGNVADTGVLEKAQQMVAEGLAQNICDALEQMYNSTPPGPLRNKIKATQKAKGCRGH